MQMSTAQLMSSNEDWFQWKIKINNECSSFKIEQKKCKKCKDYDYCNIKFKKDKND